ncbi:MAG: hypothetical protein ACFFAJ_01315 [Candidatus Hodarchaeota archaeon]
MVAIIGNIAKTIEKNSINFVESPYNSSELSGRKISIISRASVT